MVSSSRRYGVPAKQVPLRMDPADHAAIERAAKVSGQSVNSLLNGIIHTWVVSNSAPLNKADNLSLTSSVQSFVANDVYAASSAGAAAYGLRSLHTPGHPSYQEAIDILGGKPPQK